MPNIFYCDWANGNDATTNTPLGWWSVAYTGGTGPAPAADELVTGATSLNTASLTVVVAPTSGSWAGNNAAGTMYFYGYSGAFVAEQVDCAGGGHFHIAADFVYCAWKTITSGATAARIAPNDEVREKTSPIGTLMCDALWTNLSKNVVLDTAQTINVDMCESAWTGDNGTSSANGVGTTPIFAKIGSYSVKIIIDATPAANQRQAYYNIADVDLQTCQQISFWIFSEAILAAGTLVLQLCSDDACTTVVDSFPFPAVPITALWQPVVITKSGGGNLGSSIKGIRIDTGPTTLPTAGKFIAIDDIIATVTDGLNLTSLISKNTLQQSTISSTGYGNEAWLAIQSINGTTVMIDNQASTPANNGRGYSGTTETKPTYFRTPFQTTPVALTTNVQIVQDSGTSEVARIVFSGGWDPITNQQIGDTIFDGLISRGYGLSTNSKSWITITRISFVRYTIGIRVVGSAGILIDFISDLNHSYNDGIRAETSLVTELIINTIVNCCNNFSNGLNFQYPHIKITRVVHANGNYGFGITLGSSNIRIIQIDEINNNTQHGLNFATPLPGASCNIIIYVKDCGDNGISGVRFDSSNNIIRTLVIRNNNIVSAMGMNQIGKLTTTNSLLVISPNYYNAQIRVGNMDGNGCYIQHRSGYVTQQVASAGGTGKEWKIYISDSALCSENCPLELSIAKIACIANDSVTVTVYFKNSHSTIHSRLYIEPFQIAGVDSIVYDDNTGDTNRNQQSITFQPTEDGTVEIFAQVWGPNLEDVIIDDIAVSVA
ncbi:MAG: hypothetical protein M0Q51_06385 [Bacteroidales bacterium]|nr:hypothetical protein [Bacteroidales bacterium]